MRSLCVVALLLMSALPLRAQQVIVARRRAATALSPAVDHFSAVTGCRNNSVTSQACTVTVTTGDLVVFGVTSSAGTPTASGSSACNGTWTMSAASNAIAYWMWSTATGTGTCTATVAATSGTIALTGLSIKNTSGLDVTSAFTNASFHGSGACPSTNTLAYTAITTGHANDLVFTLAIDTDNNQGTFSSCDGTWTDSAATLPTIGIQVKSIASAGSVTPGVTVFSTGSTPQVVTLSAKP